MKEGKAKYLEAAKNDVVSIDGPLSDSENEPSDPKRDDEDQDEDEDDDVQFDIEITSNQNMDDLNADE